MRAPILVRCSRDPKIDRQSSSRRSKRHEAPVQSVETFRVSRGTLSGTPVRSFARSRTYPVESGIWPRW